MSLPARYLTVHDIQLIHYFTCGPDEVRAWTIRRHTKAPQAAGVIHSDFENKFVCGEIMSYEDLRENGSEAAVKAAGKLRQQGKPYESAYMLRYFPVFVMLMHDVTLDSARRRHRILEVGIEHRIRLVSSTSIQSHSGETLVYDAVETQIFANDTIGNTTQHRERVRTSAPHFTRGIGVHRHGRER